MIYISPHSDDRLGFSGMFSGLLFQHNGWFLELLLFLPGISGPVVLRHIASAPSFEQAENDPPDQVIDDRKERDSYNHARQAPQGAEDQDGKEDPDSGQADPVA